MVPQVELFSLVFWEIWRHQKDISKLTELYRVRIVVIAKIFSQTQFASVIEVAMLWKSSWRKNIW